MHGASVAIYNQYQILNKIKFRRLLVWSRLSKQKVTLTTTEFILFLPYTATQLNTIYNTQYNIHMHKKLQRYIKGVAKVCTE